jgi:2-polyprenyl-3-methyl-5-hydroxy-6-metoxy-1,4-benzoquinol methylase
MEMGQYNQYWKEHKNDVCLNLPKKGIRSRFDLLKEHLTNKSVLHIGCSDWPLTEDKVKTKDLLHQFLENITKELYGIDTSMEGLRIMKENGIKNIFFGDIYNLHNEKKLLDKRFDVLLIPEVIEHLTNPGLALESVRTYILKTNPKCKIIFTVPNNHNFWYNAYFGLRNKEVAHYDHKFYFSYRTFRNLIDNYDFEVEDFFFILYFKYPQTLKKRLIIRLLSKISPCMVPYLYFKCQISKIG